MAAVTIRWNQRVAGRFPGDVETVEATDFVMACLSQRRAEVVVPPDEAVFTTEHVGELHAILLTEEGPEDVAAGAE